VVGAVVGYLGYSLFRGPKSPDSSLKEITWNDFVNGLLPRGRVKKILINQELSQAYLLPSPHDQMDGGYVLGIKNAHNFENEVREAEVALGIPPERWIQIEYQQLSGLYVTAPDRII